MEYSEKLNLYKSNFSFGFLGSNFTNKVALLSLLGYLYTKLKDRASMLQIVKSTAPKNIPEDDLITIAVIAEDLAYGCKSFETFGLADKEIPSKIKEIFKNYCPF